MAESRESRWHGDLIDHSYPSGGAIKADTVRPLGRDRADLDGRPSHWAMVSHRVALEAVYLFPVSPEIDARHQEKALPVIHEQLAMAAARLARVLNRALRQA